MDYQETFDNGRFKLEITGGEPAPAIKLTDLYSGTVFADGPCRYSLFVDDGSRVLHLEGLRDLNITGDETAERTVFEIAGLAGAGEPDVRVRHILTALPDGEYLDEQISLVNESASAIMLRDYRIALRKELPFDPKTKTWDGTMGRFRMIAVPFRVQPDGYRHDYTMNEVYHGRFFVSTSDDPIHNVPEIADRGRGRSEGWAWTDGESGLLVMKYNPEMIEYSMLESEHLSGKTYLDFGGAAQSLYDEPREARRLKPGQAVTFGTTRYTFYEGLWRRASYIFRDFMNTHGHGHPDGYDPPMIWHIDPGQGRLPLEELRAEAHKAREIGCQLLHLESGWETCDGDSVWDDSRLGPPEEFVREMNEVYGLQIGIRTMGRSYCDAYPGLYRRNDDGSIGYYRPYLDRPFYEPCTEHPEFLREKIERLSKVAEAGVKFMTFDKYDWRGPCFAGDHGHSAPTIPDQHARNVVSIIQRLHELHPDLLAAAQDCVWSKGVRYLPTYYLHGQPGSFEEGRALGLTGKPMQDLLTGRALSLFYHSLAYELPVYAHISMDDDNEECLVFWWYASTARHLGISGKPVNERQFAAYKKAVSEYLSFKDLYTHGDFYGYDEVVHVHVLGDEGRGVLNAFNLTNQTMTRQVEVSLPEIGLTGVVTAEGVDYRLTGSRLIVQLEIPPLSPVVVRLAGE
ncbi:MAG: hypothetical protein HYX78_09210 [Armatimonadetes bacterium]|nr:hypothetical protein [Armatimonadota bacterium]